MSDILHVLPKFDLQPHSRIIPSLDKANITTADLLAAGQPADVAQRAHIPTGEVTKLIEALLEALRAELEPTTSSEWTCISLLDDGLDQALGGGCPVGYLTEITGESGAGKTQFLLTLLLSVQLLGRDALYISTEAPLSTARLDQLIKTHPKLASLPEDEKPTLSKVHAIQTLDLEAQEQIIRYQVPVAIERWNVGLVIIDSIASNYRAEFDELPGTPKNSRPSNSKAMGDRMRLLTQLGSFLRDLARTQKVAIVVANQVADRFEQPFSSTPTDPLSLDHQQKWLTGWGDEPYNPALGPLKTPSLGLVWTNQISTRIALVKETAVEERKRRRWFRLVFSSWAAQTDGIGVEFEITEEGITTDIVIKSS
jgi:DNA repair protein RAD57